MNKEIWDEMLVVGLRNIDIDNFFDKPKVSEAYRKIRMTPVVDNYYQSLIDDIKKMHNDCFANSLVDTEENFKDNETTIKKQLLQLALEQMLVQGIDSLEVAVITVITEKNLLIAIDDFGEILNEALNKIINETPI